MSYPNRATAVNPLLALSSTLKERAEVGLSGAAYFNGQLSFNKATVANLAHTDFYASLFVDKRGIVVPFKLLVAAPEVANHTGHLASFTRLALLDAVGFYLFLSLNLKLKFVLCSFDPRRPLDDLYGAFHFHE